MAWDDWNTKSLTPARKKMHGDLRFQRRRKKESAAPLKPSQFKPKAEFS
jgi:hypothetical protein